jgi:predicted acetyltransferase
MSDFITRPLTEHDWRKALTLHNQVFGENPIFTALPHHPHFAYHHLRGGFYRGQLISLVHAYQRVLHYGVAQWRIGAISHVCTDEDFRYHGFASAVMRDTLAYLAEQGAHMAMLSSGIADYYTRFGFSAVLPDYKLSVPVVDALKIHSHYTVRLPHPNEIRAIRALYNRHWGSKVTFSRDDVLWQHRLRHHPPLVAVAPNGAIEGYTWRHPIYDIWVETVINSMGALMALLKADAHVVQAQRVNTLTWIVPPDDLMISLLRPHIEMTLSAQYRPTHGWMARLIDSTGFVQSLLQEIQAHLRITHPNLSEKPHIVVKSDRVEVAFRKQSCHLSHRDFIQVVFGSLSADMLAIQQQLSSDVVDMLHTLFPPRIACIGAWDWM